MISTNKTFLMFDNQYYRIATDLTSIDNLTLFYGLRNLIVIIMIINAKLK